MKPWDANATPDESTYDPEIQQWFQGLGAPPVQVVSPYLQAKVRARILDKQRQANHWSWTSWLSRPVWASALAAVFIVSISANVWWGVGGQESGTTRVADAGQTLTVDPFLSENLPTQALQVAVKARPLIESEGVGRGFVSGQNQRVLFFRMGTAYADALAAVHGQALDLASAHLQQIAAILRQMETPAVLSSYLQELSVWMQSSDYGTSELAQLLTLFEPFYAAVVNRQNRSEAVSLFQVAAWLENMALAASIPHYVMPSHLATLELHRKALTRLQPPQNVMASFDQLRILAVQETLTKSERQQIQHLVQTIQQLLGAIAR